MDGSNKHLTQRADGWVETKNGDLAITMIVSTNDLPEGKRYFEFALTNFANSRLEWNVEDMLQIFPQEIAVLMIRRHWAILPTRAAIDWYEDRMAQLEDEAKEAADAAVKAVEAAKAPQGMAKEPAPADAPEAGTKEEEKTSSEATAAPAVAPAPDAEATAATTSATKKVAKQ